MTDQYFSDVQNGVGFLARSGLWNAGLAKSQTLGGSGIFQGYGWPGLAGAGWNLGQSNIFNSGLYQQGWPYQTALRQ